AGVEKPPRIAYFCAAVPYSQPGEPGWIFKRACFPEPGHSAAISCLPSFLWLSLKKTGFRHGLLVYPAQECGSKSDTPPPISVQEVCESIQIYSCPKVIFYGTIV